MSPKAVVFVSALFAIHHECFAASSWPSLALFDLFGLSNYSRCDTPAPDTGCDNVTFYLYKSDGPRDGVRVDLKRRDSLSEAGFDPKEAVKVLIHGYSGNRDCDPNIQVRPAYLSVGGINVFSVDWAPFAKEPCYFSAAKSVPVAGACTAALIDAIVAAGVPSEDVHIVGFSLGAHVAGYASSTAATGPVGRITGLDPALPLFATAYDEPVLDASDADFVDVIHTNAGNKGKLGPNGHADFYVNGGFMQPWCDPPRVIDRHSCSHSRAPEVFAESIASSDGFWGVPCASWWERLLGRCEDGEAKVMGEHAERGTRGMFLVNTRSEPPFAMGRSTRREPNNG